VKRRRSPKPQSEEAARYEAGLRATHCLKCGVVLPTDRLQVAAEETATQTNRGLDLALRLRSGVCLKCSEPGARRAGRPLSGEDARSAGQAHGLRRTRS
jgi:hypothetical protein